MKKNMGVIDRLVRTLLAIIVLLLYWTGNISGLAAIILGIFAIIFIITSTISFCPLYVLLKISTRREK
ncbi:MAG: DUF2892 domain-containing protein [Deltaproteobacteria bacterium]|nr:DUF2892 domain-containing protein [Deltaproteobacteria bacterium]